MAQNPNNSKLIWKTINDTLNIEKETKQQDKTKVTIAVMLLIGRKLSRTLIEILLRKGK